MLQESDITVKMLCEETDPYREVLLRLVWVGAIGVEFDTRRKREAVKESDIWDRAWWGGCLAADEIALDNILRSLNAADKRVGDRVVA